MMILIKTEKGNYLNLKAIAGIGKRVRQNVADVIDNEFMHGITALLFGTTSDSIMLFASESDAESDLWMDRFDQEVSYLNGSEAKVYTIDINDHVRDLYRFQQNEGKNDENSN